MPTPDKLTVENESSSPKIPADPRTRSRSKVSGNRCKNLIFGGRDHRKAQNISLKSKLAHDPHSTLKKLNESREHHMTKHNSYVQINQSRVANLRQAQPVPAAGTDYRFCMGITAPGDTQDFLLKNSSLKFPKKKNADLSERVKCRNCQKYYNNDKNHPGSCSEAPVDKWFTVFEHLSCYTCANSVIYNCFKDSNGDYQEYSTVGSLDSPEGKRHLLLRIGLFCCMPLLVFYPLFWGLYKCAVRCKCCGGRHMPPSPSLLKEDPV